MQCSHPLFRIPVYPWENVKIADVKVRNGALLFSHNKYDYDFLKSVVPKNVLSRLQLIPCGKCMPCRINLAEQWSNRCLLELKDFNQAIFVTLTYDDEHLQFGYRINSRYKTLTYEPSLVKRDLQLFNKKLRKYYDDKNIKFRFFACGEYGGRTARPHYHIIYFGLPLPFDCKILKANGPNTLYSSEFLASLWGKGLVSVGSVSADSIAYVARYTTKKFRSSFLSPLEREWFDQQKDFVLSELQDKLIEDDFLLMSRRPGIGYNYFQKNACKMLASDRMIFYDGVKTRILRPSRYFDRLFDINYPSDFKRLKDKRKLRCKSISRITASASDLDELSQMHLSEQKAKEILTKMPRASI